MRGARSSLGSGGRLLAQRVAAQFETVSGVDDAIEDRIGDGRIADQVVPAVDRDLAGDDGGAASLAERLLAPAPRRTAGTA
jgi:hypothetical protein